MSFPSRSFLAAVALAIAGCGGGDGKSGQVVSIVMVSPVTPTIVVGQSSGLTATALDKKGQAVLGQTATWKSDDTSVASVNATGNVTALKAGQTKVHATINGKTAFATVTVTNPPPPPPPVARVDMNPTAASPQEGSELQAAATPRDANGNIVNGRVVQWSSSNPAVATVSGAGLITALKPGTTSIIARVDGVHGTLPVAVTASYQFDLAFDAWNGAAGVANELYALDINDPAALPVQLLPAGTKAQDIASSPDGSKFAFVGSTDTTRGLWVANRDGSNLVRLTTNAGDSQPAWSPDGSKIAFRRWPQGEGADIWVIDAATGANAKNLTLHLGAINQHAPTWAPASQGVARIAYVQNAGADSHIWTMQAADGLGNVQLTTGSVADSDPSWSPDGSMIAFTRSATAIFGDLYRVPAGGGGAQRLIELPLFQRTPAWSPDGALIAFSSAHEGNVEQIYTIRANGLNTGLARRTSGSQELSRPAWLPRPQP